MLRQFKKRYSILEILYIIRQGIWNSNDCVLKFAARNARHYYGLKTSFMIEKLEEWCDLNRAFKHIIK